MPRPGENLPDFIARQREFAAHIRNPTANPPPPDIEPRRMQVYVDLFFDNVERLLAGVFPVAKRVLGAERWPALVRAFVDRHACSSPYFSDVSQEFIQFINELEDVYLPPFMIELCHYEWVELGLTLADAPSPVDVDPAGDLLAGVVVRSPLAWLFSYAYPVHRIGLSFQPDAPSEQPTHLVVYRRPDDSVRFMELNAVTQRLLLLLDGTVTGRAALGALAGEVPEPARAVIGAAGFETLERLRSAGILLGARVPVLDAGSDPDFVRVSTPAGETRK